MKSLLSMLIALVIALTTSHPAFVTETERDSRQPEPRAAAVPFTSGEAFDTGREIIDLEGDPVTAPPPCLPAPVADDEPAPEEETVDLEGDPVAAPPPCLPAPVADDEPAPEEGTVDLEGDPVAEPPPCLPAPVADDEPAPEEGTIDLEADPVAGPPIEEPTEP